MKSITFALMMSLILGFQQRPILEVFRSAEVMSFHAHENLEHSILEMTEIILTGNLIHTHSHEQSEGDSHAHSHQHNFSNSISNVIFILTHLNFSFSLLEQGWDLIVTIPDPNPYHSEILRPPISPKSVS